MGKIRLFVENEKISVGTTISLPEKQSHYLANVMKQNIGDNILVFNGKDGEFEAAICGLSKRQVEVRIKAKTKEFKPSEDIWLLFAPLKKDNTDFVIEKSTELGVKKLIPVITQYTISDKTKTERFIAQAIEAAEQCRRLDIPEVATSVKLKDLLQNWNSERKLFYMDESGAGEAISEVFKNAPAPLAVLVGPEGGFSKEELDFLRSMPYTKSVSLGPLILRAETASVAALTCWQALSGSWK